MRRGPSGPRFVGVRPSFGSMSRTAYPGSSRLHPASPKFTHVDDPAELPLGGSFSFLRARSCADRHRAVAGRRDRAVVRHPRVPDRRQQRDDGRCDRARRHAVSRRAQRHVRGRGGARRAREGLPGRRLPDGVRRRARAAHRQRRRDPERRRRPRRAPEGDGLTLLLAGLHPREGARACRRQGAQFHRGAAPARAREPHRRTPRAADHAGRQNAGHGRDRTEGSTTSCRSPARSRSTIARRPTRGRCGSRFRAATKTCSSSTTASR